MQLRLLVYKWDNLERVVEEPRKSIGRRQQLLWHFFRCLKNGCTKSLFSNILGTTRKKLYRYCVLSTYITTCSHVENIWDPWSESQHNDGKGCKKQKNIFHHNIDAEYDGAKVFCGDANLYYKFDNYQSNNGEKFSLYNPFSKCYDIIRFNTNLDCL